MHVITFFTVRIGPFLPLHYDCTCVEGNADWDYCSTCECLYDHTYIICLFVKSLMVRYEDEGELAS